MTPSQVGQTEFPYGDGFEVLPAKGAIPAMWCGVTALEAGHPGYSEWKRHILWVVGHEGRTSWGYLLASAYVSLLRVQRVLAVLHEEPGLSDRICIALQKNVTLAFLLSLRLGLCH